jgi:OmpA-OmpF porin, OOP family
MKPLIISIFLFLTWYNSHAQAQANEPLTAYSKFDFVPGEKVIAIDDFMQDAIGDFPAKWSSTGSGEVVTLEGQHGRWLMLNKKGEYLPEYIKNLPDNATLQFDLASTNNFAANSSGLFIGLAALSRSDKKNAGLDLSKHLKDEARVSLHPNQFGSGHTIFETYTGGKRVVNNNTKCASFSLKEGRNIVKVAIWKQKQRLRIYIGEDKIWDVAQAFQSSIAYNSVVFALNRMGENDAYYISNIRLAVGAPDTRNKLITEGKFVTNGILFDPNSDKIKPESNGTLKEIANVLAENAAIRVRVIGHTDADGDNTANLSLSKRRAVAVKAALSTAFGIDANRIETDGKGETQPASSNTTAEGKANNRRVEFIKL